MTIIFKSGNETVSTSAVIYANGNAMKKMAAQMIADQVEGSIDMIMDMPEDYPTKQDIEKVLSSAKEQCIDMFDDYIDTIRGAWKAALDATNFTARVVRIDYYNEQDQNLGDYKDIHVEVRVDE